MLTGIATGEPVVWYSADHIVGWRIGTIPVEDLFYNLGLFLPIAWIYEKQLPLKRKRLPLT
jgi:lycopene cyclase domain-containing protein